MGGMPNRTFQLLPMTKRLFPKTSLLLVCVVAVPRLAVLLMLQLIKHYNIKFDAHQFLVIFLPALTHLRII